MRSLYQFVTSAEAELYAKDEHHSSIQFWHITDLILRIIFGRSRCAWPHPYKWTKSNRFVYSLPHAKNKFHNSTHSWDKADSLFTITVGMSRPVWPHPVEATNEYLLLSWTYSHIQKFDFILQVIFEILYFKESFILTSLEVLAQ